MPLDVRGLACPQPVAAVRRRLASLEPGDELVVVGDDEATAGSIRRACERRGYDVRRVESGEAGAGGADPMDDDARSTESADEDADAISLRIRATAFATLGGDGDPDRT